MRARNCVLLACALGASLPAAAQDAPCFTEEDTLITPYDFVKLEGGSGGLKEWWPEAQKALEENPRARVRPRVAKSIAPSPPINIIDDSDPVTKAHRSDVNRVGFAVEMAYNGGGRETRRPGQ